jgi:DNA polymerase I-like protein with 3'-5' exonuclease and polymerase domains
VLESLGLLEQNAFQQRLFWAALRAMQLGVRVDLERRAQITAELGLAIEDCDRFISDVLGHPLNVRSSPQMAGLFYGDLAQKPVMSRAKKNQPSHVSCDDEALQVVAKREPLLRSLVDKILHRRSLSVLKTSFAEARLGEDGRMRCSLNICGTETFRLSSSQDAFGSGLNLQTIPDENTKASVKAERRGESIPNIKAMFVPDPGYTFFNLDLDRADLHVVVWEADDAELKAVLRSGADIHAENAKVLGCDRELAKSFIHGTNYGGSSRTMAIVCGISTHIADAYQRRWFGAHPGIHRWHTEVERRLNATREVHNAFGYRRHYFGRLEGLLPEALAWIPQSCVSCAINRAWVHLYENQPDIQTLLQVHDSLAGQFKTLSAEPATASIKECCKVIIPYPHPLVIPTSLKTSPVSWGACA